MLLHLALPIAPMTTATSPLSPAREKWSSKKPVLGAKKVRDRCVKPLIFLSLTPGSFTSKLGKYGLCRPVGCSPTGRKESEMTKRLYSLSQFSCC